MLLGLVLGWTAGYMRIPFVDVHFSIWLGAVLAFTGVFFSWLLWWSRERLKKQHASPFKANLLWLLFLSPIFFLAAARYNEMSKAMDRSEEAQGRLQTLLLKKEMALDSLLHSDRQSLIGHVLDQVASDLQDSSRVVKEETIAQIVALSHSLKMGYLKSDQDTFIHHNPLSGDLLIQLANMNIDSASWSTIKSRATFEFADLRKQKMAGLDLSGANLKFADLSHALLVGANLSYADLTDATLNGARLKNADCIGTKLVRANLENAELNRCNLELANLDGANVRFASCYRMRLKEASAEFAHFDGALMTESNLQYLDTYWTTFRQVNFTDANLSEANLRSCDFEAVNLTGAQLNHVVFNEPDWLGKLDEWKVIGGQEIKNAYRQDSSRSERFPEMKFWLQLADAVQ